MRKYYVYALLDPTKGGEPFYVGKGSGNRRFHHLTNTKKNTKNRHKQIRIDHIRSLGMEPDVVILEEGLDNDAAYQIEADLIRLMGRRGYEAYGVLTNACIDNRPPPRTGKPHSEETKRKMSEAIKGRVRSPEHREALSKALKGVHTGKTRTDEQKKKMSEWQLGKPKSDVHRQAMSEAHAGVSRTGLVTWEIVREIRLLARLGLTRKQVNERFPQLGYCTVSDIIAERSWKEEFRPRK